MSSSLSHMFLICSYAFDRLPGGCNGEQEASMRRTHIGSWKRGWIEIIALLFGCVLVASQAVAQDPRQNEPGKFDFYLLALSWSPSFCAEAGERNSSSKS